MNLWIVASMEEELALLIAAADARVKGRVGGFPFFAGAMGDRGVNLGVTGVGVAAACVTLGALCGSARPDLMVMVGSAGSLPGSGLKAGDMVVAETEILAELGVVAGPGIGDAHGMRLPGLMQEIPLDQAFSSLLLHHAVGMGTAVSGRFLTVAGSSANDDHARDRKTRFQALAENMEGYALALSGSRFGFKTAEIRGISNRAGDRDKSHWDFKKAIVPPQEVLLEYLRKRD
jgi:futalosine hydrolase